jgi:hypothetical protein
VHQSLPTPKIVYHSTIWYAASSDQVWYAVFPAQVGYAVGPALVSTMEEQRVNCIQEGWHQLQHLLPQYQEGTAKIQLHAEAALHLEAGRFKSYTNHLEVYLLPNHYHLAKAASCNMGLVWSGQLHPASWTWQVSSITWTGQLPPAA